MSVLPGLENLASMKWSEKKAVVYNLSGEDAVSYLDQIEEKRHEGGISEQVGKLKESLIARVRYLDRFKGPVEVDNLVRMSQADAQATIYEMDLGTASALKVETSHRLAEKEKGDGGYYPLKNVDNLLNRRMFFLKSENKEPQHVGVEDLLYLNQDKQQSRIAELNGSQVNNLIVELSMVMHDGQRAGQENPAKIDGRHERVFAELAKAFHQGNKEVGTGGYTLAKLERLEPKNIEEIANVLPGSAVVKLYGESVERSNLGKLHGSEQQVHDALKTRVEHGLDIDKVMSTDRATAYIKHYGQSDVVELLNQLPAYEQKDALGLVGYEEEIAQAITDRADRLNQASTLKVAEVMLAPLSGKSPEEVASTLAEMPEAQRDGIVNFTYGLIASDTILVGFDQDSLTAIVNDGIGQKDTPQILADLVAAKIADVREFLKSEPEATLEALQDLISSADRTDMSKSMSNKLGKISEAVEQNLESVRSQGAAMSAG